MGAKHPADLINKLNCCRNEFIIACSYLVRMGIVKRAGDAIRYMESKEIQPQEVFEKYSEFKEKQRDIVGDEE